jgi:hypothetical protein
MDAIGEDATLFDDMNKPYAITNLPGTSKRGVEEETWRSKEIEARLFELRSGGQPFGPLWESIGKWADWARGGPNWAHSKLANATSTKYADANPFDIAFVQDLFAVLTDDERNRAAEYLNGLKVDFGWIAAIQAATIPGAPASS